MIENFRDMIHNVNSFSWIVDWPGGRSTTKDGRGGRLLVRNFQMAGEPQPQKQPDERWYEAGGPAVLWTWWLFVAHSWSPVSVSVRSRCRVHACFARGGKKVDERSGPWFDMMCTGQPSVTCALY